jgi:uncharacterized protein YegP (UPF0339 family)
MRSTPTFEMGGNNMAAKFELYKDKIGEFRWKLTHTNGKVIADSGEGYTSKVNAMNGINSVRGNAPDAAFEDKTNHSAGSKDR